MLKIAHRGAKGHAPENTLKAIQTALDLGSDWIEIDIHPVEDDFVVFHDRWLMRTTNGFGRVRKKTLAYLQQLDAGDGQKIPTLGDVVRLIDGQAGLNIELKGKIESAPLIRYLDTHLPANSNIEQIMFSTFRHQQLLEIKQLNPIYKRAPIIWRSKINLGSIKQQLDAYSVNIWFPLINQNLVKQVHEHSLKMWAYTVNKPADIEKMRHLGVDGVITNFPERV